MHEKEFDLKNFMTLLTIITLVITIAISIAILLLVSRPASETPIYTKEGIEVYYKRCADAVQIVNDNEQEVKIVLEMPNGYKNTHFISNTQGNKSMISLTSGYGEYVIKINDNNVPIIFEEFGGDHNPIVIPIVF